ncbi:MAG: hypothetical protein IJP61_09375 [Treponema sp.]|nr:hypothetical protein [Treponema sp.]
MTKICKKPLVSERSKIIKHLIKFLPMLLLSFFLTSCVDYVQTVGYKGGKYQLYYKVTLSKALFALADSDPEEIFKDFDKEAMGELPKNVQIHKVNTDLEVGTEFSIELSPKSANKDEISFLPKIEGKKCYIPFLLGGESGEIAESFSSEDAESQTMTQAFLASAKCRIMLEKNLAPKIETAYFEGRGGQNYSIPVFDYGPAYCLEIPFIVLFENGMYNFNQIVVILK